MSATRERARIVAALRNWAKIADDPDFAAYAQDAKSAIAFASMIEEGIGSFAWPAEPKPKFYSRTPDEGYGAFAEHDSAEAAQTTATGITLIAAAYMLKVSLSWSDADEQQAEKRIIRYGQTRPVIIESIIADHPVEHLVLGVLARKAARAAATWAR